MQSITNKAPSQIIQITTAQLDSIPCLKFKAGNQQGTATGVSSTSNIIEGSLVFTSSYEDTLAAISKKANVIVSVEKFVPESLNLNPYQAIYCCQSIPEAMAHTLNLFDKKQQRLTPGISEKAQIAHSAKIGTNVTIGPFSYIGEGATVGDNTIISSNVVIEQNAAVGSNCLIHPTVVIGAHCKLGDRCEVHSNTTIGSDGFAFYLDKESRPQKIPQIGIVVIDDDVEIGASCSIDRATISETRIGSGTKLDNQIHIAHNVKIGKNCRITAGFIIAGSSEIGDNFLTGGSSSVTDHVKITSNVILAGRSTVTNDIDMPGAYGGYPLEPLKSAIKTTANIAKLTGMRKQIHEIRKHLGLKTEGE